MAFAIWSSLGRREHAMDRASKILNIAIEIGERCELHICSLCVVKGRHSNHCWRWHLQPAAVTPSKRLMPEKNRECRPSETVGSASASCSLPGTHQLRQAQSNNPQSHWAVWHWATGNKTSD